MLKNMSTNSYQLYQEGNRRLARTIVIKSELTAQLMNEQLIKEYGITSVHPTDPTTWRYYKHISGEYHETDKLMYVRSWDTTEEILFSKENLAIHRATARAYAFGSKPFQMLLEAFPNQDLLILGILYPADKIKAIAAPDYSVLAYPPELIEENEFSLVEKISTFAKNLMQRWFNPQYCISDNLYPAAMLSVLYMQLYLAICNFRLEVCKTAEAHSFHVNQYLMSYGVPENVLKFLTKKQSLFLYRNIKYIRIHAGSNDTLEWLIENLFTVRNLPLCKYTMRHFDDDQIDKLFPTVYFKSIPVNSILGETAGDVIDTKALLRKEQEVTLGNSEYIQNNTEAIEFKFATADSNVVQTKVLESALTDYTNAVYTNIDSIFLSYWPYLCKLGKLLSFVNFTNSKTGESMMISASDAYILLIYAGARALGVELTIVPPAYCERVMRWPTPDVSDYQAISATITVAEIERIRKLLPEIDAFVSIDSFNAFCRAVQQMEFDVYKLYANQHSHFRRAEMKAVVLRSFTDSWVDLDGTGMPYSEWLASKNINLELYSKTDFETLYGEIFTAAVGSDIVVAPNLAEIQNAMSTLLMNFSSYSIQLVNYVNDTNVFDLKRPAIRASIEETQMDVELFIPVSCTYAQSVLFSKDVNISEQMATPDVVSSVLTTQDYTLKYSPKIHTEFDSEHGITYAVNLNKQNIRLMSFDVVSDPI